MRVSNIDQMIELSNRFKGQLKEAGIIICDDYLVKIYPESMELVLTKEQSMEREFGGEIDVTNYKQYGSDTGDFKIGKGSMGGFDMDCRASCESHLAIAQMIQNFSVFKALAIRFMDSTKE